MLAVGVGIGVVLVAVFILVTMLVLLFYSKKFKGKSNNCLSVCRAKITARIMWTIRYRMIS